MDTSHDPGCRRRPQSGARFSWLASLALLITGIAIHPARAGMNEWSPLGPDGGWVLDLAFHPTVPGSLFALAPAGLFRSTDNGLTWQRSPHTFIDYPTSLALNRVNPDRVLVAATDRLLMSADRGTSFTTAAPAPSYSYRVKVSRDGATAYFAAGARIYLSRDQGQTWQQRSPVSNMIDLVNGLEIDPTNPDIVYASNFGYGIFASQDAGATWQSRSPNLTPYAEMHGFVVDPGNPQRLLAATQTGLYISNDGGLTWPAHPITTEIVDVDVDPANSSNVYATNSLGVIRKSTDGGVQWTVLYTAKGEFSLPRLTISPLDSSIMMLAAGDGILITLDGGATWQPRNTGFQAARVTTLTRGPSRTYVATASGLHTIADGSATTVTMDNAALLQLPQASFFTLNLVSTGGPQETLFATLGGLRIARSTDRGKSWSYVLIAGPLFPRVVTPSPLEPQTIFAGTADGILKSTDNGTTWVLASLGLPAGVEVSSIVASSSAPLLYATTYAYPTGLPTPSRLFRSTDSGASWTAVGPAITDIFTGLSLDPRNDQVLYVGMQPNLFKSTDGGATWKQLKDARGFAICCGFMKTLVDPADSRFVYAMTSSQLYRSVDAGETWETLGNGTPLNVPLLSGLAIDGATNNTILLGTTGSGVRQLTLAPDLELTITPPTSLTPNASGTYTLGVRNLGPYDATRVRVSAQLPANATAVSAAGTGATCTTAGTTVTCTYDVVRAYATRLQLSVNATPPVAGAFSMTATIAGDQPDIATANNTAANSIDAGAPPTSPPPSQPGSGGGGGGGTLTFELLLALAAMTLRATRSRRPALRAGADPQGLTRSRGRLQRRRVQRWDENPTGVAFADRRP